MHYTEQDLKREQSQYDNAVRFLQHQRDLLKQAKEHNKASNGIGEFDISSYKRGVEDAKISLSRQKERLCRVKEAIKEEKAKEAIRAKEAKEREKKEKQELLNKTKEENARLKEEIAIAKAEIKRRGTQSTGNNNISSYSSQIDTSYSSDNSSNDQVAHSLAIASSLLKKVIAETSANSKVNNSHATTNKPDSLKNKESNSAKKIISFIKSIISKKNEY